jgi:hypothetical protein
MYQNLAIERSARWRPPPYLSERERIAASFGEPTTSWKGRRLADDVQHITNVRYTVIEVIVLQR